VIVVKIQRLIIHHSLTKDGSVVDFDAIKRYHIQHNGWRNIGYHYVIERVGDKYVIKQGRPEIMVGAHCKEQHMNALSLGICLVGNFDLAPPPKEQMELAADLCAKLCEKHKIPVENIDPHSKYATYKSCPGTKFPMDKLRQMAKERLEQ
jgi:N-acetylmuramoyl-L-alanine amidase